MHLSLLVVPMSLKEKLDKFTKIGEEIVESASDAFDKTSKKVSKKLGTLKEEAYKGVNAATEKLDELKNSDVGKKVGEVSTNVVDSVKKYNADVQSKGGYAAALKRVYDNVSADVEHAATKIDEALFTDGEFDPAKANVLLHKGTDSVKLYGQKAVDGIGELLSEAKDGIVKDYRSVIPTADELAGRYAGIGTQYEGMLIRKNYEKVLSFVTKIEANVPGQVKVKKDVLSDVKAHAIQNKTELKKYYKDDEVKSKVLLYL